MVLDYYPEDPAKGSPYNTGSENAITPQYKRIASFVVRKFLSVSRSS